MALPRTLLRGAGALALAATMALASGAATVLAADPPTTTDPGAAAAGWMAVQVKDSVGPGTLADAIFAYAAAGVGADATASALARLESVVDGYILDGKGHLVPGNLAKAMLAVQVAGGDVSSFGGHDLEADLRGLLITTPGPDLGRFGTGAGGEDPDTTSLALQALLAGGASGAAATSTQLLLDIQGPDGAFSSYGTPNTNSSGVAGQALRAAGRTKAADAAGAFVLTLQYGCDAPAANRGAFPWAASSAGFLVFSTPQAVLALGAPRLDKLTIDGASAAAPVLDCPVAKPTASATSARPGATAVVTLPPTDLGVAGATGAPVDGSSMPAALLLLVAIAGGAMAAVRLRARR